MRPLIDPRKLELRGRSTELRSLEKLMRGVASGSGGVIVIEGEAGIGKTRLAREAERMAADSAIRCYAAAARRLEMDRPFGLLSDLLGIKSQSDDPQRAALAALLLQGEGTGRQVRYRIVEGLSDVVERLALEEPLALVVEDLHWADPGTLGGLARIARITGQFPVALVCTLRPTPRQPDLAALTSELEEIGVVPIVPSHLSPDEMRDLAAEVLGAPPSPAIESAVATTAGNPLFASEMIAALTEEDDGVVAGGRGDIDQTPLPRSLQLTILRRLAAFPPDILEMLRLASIFGSRCTARELGALRGATEVELMRLLDEPLRGGFLVDDGGAIAFRHEVVRDAIYFDLPESVRMNLHRRAAETLTQLGTSMSRIAPHVVLGAEHGDDTAIDWLWEAGNNAAPTEPSVAVGLLERSAELCRPGDPRIGRIAVDVMLPLMWAGRFDEAEKLARGTLDQIPTSDVQTALRMRLGDCLGYQGRAADAVEELKLAAAQVEEGPQLARLFGTIAHEHRPPNREEGLRFAERALALADRYDDDVARVLAHMARCWLLTTAVDMEASIEAGTRAVEIARRCDDPEALRRIPQRQLALALSLCGRVDEARDMLSEARAVGERVGTSWHLPYLNLVSATNSYVAGEWDDALAEIETCFALVGGSRFLDAETAGARLVLIKVFRDDLAAATDALALTVGQNPMSALWPRAVLFEAIGDHAAATSAVTSFLQLARDPDAVFVLSAPDLTRVAVSCGNNAQAQELALRTEETARHAGIERATAAALCCRGLAERDPETLHNAVGAYRSTPCLPELAMAAEDAGALLVETGSNEQGIAYLEEALSIYERLRADRLIARVEALLRRAGVRMGARTRKARAKKGWESLTPTERKVIELVAVRLSNREIAERLFISKRTVETHISHLLQKLDAGNRGELIAAINAGIPTNVLIPGS